MIQFPAFRPHPMLRSGHVQTIVGSLVGGRVPRYGAIQHQVQLDAVDATMLHDDCPASWKATDRAVLLVHGLCGSHQSPYVARAAAKLNARGVRTFRMDLRSHGGGAALASKIGHAGRSGDVAAALTRVMELCPQAPVHLVGFSMGGNIVLKLAAEFGKQAPANLAGVFAAAPPVDLHFCCQHLSRGWNFLYDRAFSRNLKRHFTTWAKQNPQVSPLPELRTIRRIFDFDERVTAPRSGFKDAAEYYAHSSSGPLLTAIHIPALIVASADDPIVPITCIQSAARSATTQLIVTEHGGHLGYVGSRGADPDGRWLDWRIVDWVLAERQLVRRPVFEALAAPLSAGLIPAACRSA